MRKYTMHNYALITSTINVILATIPLFIFFRRLIRLRGGWKKRYSNVHRFSLLGSESDEKMAKARDLYRSTHAPTSGLS